ncbi:hypothetical protein HZH66_002500 [Vespula vulgaris]|uniref:Uncharacterized protein n=1 Tax=Vespula vulgaris TaxID=7454 RepID=A0A834KJY9_VESVU|nr:hypothetical protein HZH66_002500 [Vespula vulgaris]
MHVSRKEFYLVPIIEFIETVPKEISERVSLSVGKDMEAAISVFSRLQVSTVQAFGLATKDSQDEGATRESSFVLLQFVNALKSLQARGIEESSKSLSNVMLCREDKDVCYRLYLLQGLNVDTCDVRREEKVSLCQCALVALQQLHLTKRLPLVQELLLREKAVTLSQVKSLLEFTLWGPADVTLGGPREREVALQRWLDLERATILHALVRTRAPLTITDEYQLLFLVRTSAKTMCEASILLDEQRNRSVCDISNDPQMSSYTNRHGAYASVFRAEHANLTGYTSAYGNTSTYVSSDVYQQRYDNGYPAVASHAMATLGKSSATGREVVKRTTLIASGN